MCLEARIDERVGKEDAVPIIGDHLLAASPGSLCRSCEPFDSLSLPSSPLERASGLDCRACPLPRERPGSRDRFFNCR